MDLIVEVLNMCEKSDIHILFLISSLQKGGAQRVLVNLANSFYKKGYEVTIVTQYKAEEEYEIEEGIKRVFSEISSDRITSKRIVNFIRRFVNLRQIWKELKPDVIISFIGKNNLMSILTSRFLNIPVVVSVRGEPHEEYASNFIWKGANFLFSFASGVILQTEMGKDMFAKRVQKKAVVLQNPINEKFIRPIYTGERESTIISVGRIDENKNHRLLIDAFSDIAEDYPSYKVVIYGEGESRSKLQNLVKEKGLEDRVLMPGSIDEVAQFVERSKIFVLTSNTEGMPNALIEAMVLGVPSISTDCPCGGPRELITDGGNGFLIPVNGRAELAEKLKLLIEDEELYKRVSLNARKLADKLNPTAVFETWENYILSIISEGKRGK